MTMDPATTAPAPVITGRPRQAAAASVRYPPDAASCAGEMISIVAYLTSHDGPLQTWSTATSAVSPWHTPLLGKAAERLEVIDRYMRARVAFLVAGRDRGYYAPDAELGLAGATLDAGRAATLVVEALLASRLPTPNQFEAFGMTALRLHPALDAAHAEREAAPRR